MNEVRVSATAVFNPGPKKPPPVRATFKGYASSFSYGVPPVTVKAPPVSKVIPVTFNPGAVKAAPVRGKATAKAKAPNRVRVTATAKPRNFVVRAKAKARAMLAPTIGHRAKPHDHKSAVSRCVHVPKALAQGKRNYTVIARVVSFATYWRPANSKDRKTARSRCEFGSFSSRPPSFRWN